MRKHRYTLIGWTVWKIVKLMTKWKLTPHKRAKAGAAAAVALVLVGGVVAAKSGNGDAE